MVRLMILGCILLSYFVHSNTLANNDEVEVGFRELFNSEVQENQAIDSDQIPVPRFARCLKCKVHNPVPVQSYPRECLNCGNRSQASTQNNNYGGDAQPRIKLPKLQKTAGRVANAVLQWIKGKRQ